MNTDQTTSLIRGLCKAIGAALLAHGASKAASIVNGEDTIGLIVMIIGFVSSHFVHKDDSTSSGSATPLIAALLLPCALLFGGCKTPKFEAGGAYAGVTSTNAAGDVLQVTEPEQALYLADQTYKFAYTTVFNVLQFERDHRAEIQKISPKIKEALDVVRPKVKDIDYRWAVSRQAYKLNPTPAGLSTIKLVIADIQRLIPVAQAEIDPVFAQVTN